MHDLEDSLYVKRGGLTVLQIWRKFPPIILGVLTLAFALGTSELPLPELRFWIGAACMVFSLTATANLYKASGVKTRKVYRSEAKEIFVYGGITFALMVLEIVLAL